MLARAANGSGLQIFTVSSNLELDGSWTADFDLIVLDWDTNGAEFVVEVAEDLRLQNDRIPILLIGRDIPLRSLQDGWPTNILGFCTKSQGPDGVLSDFLHVLAPPSLALETQRNRGKDARRQKRASHSRNHWAPLTYTGGMRGDPES